MIRPAESLKAIANELAQQIAGGSQDDNTLQALLQQLVLVAYDQDSPAAVPGFQPPPAANRRVGVWTPEALDGKKHYVRNKEISAEWTYWANVNRIPPKSEKRRVVMVGESVARGYLYDPHYTPALALESYLNKAGVLGEVEVIDLAKTSVDIDELTETTVASFDLEPDALVVFAGNNWCNCLFSNVPFTDGELQQMNDCLVAGDLTGIKAVSERKIRQMTLKFVQTVEQHAKAHGVVVVFMIPEFNLLDWVSSSTEKAVARLPAGLTLEWLEARNAARGALAREDFAAVAPQAQRMIDLDQSNPEGYELLAKCQLRQGEWAEARTLLELGRDTAVFCRAFSKPRMLSAAREVLLREVPARGMGMVDLPTVFNQYLEGQLPDRRLFLDYCHLTVEGIQVATAHTTQRLVQAFTGRTLSIEEISAESLQPNTQIIAMAHVFAAVHNAHFEQPYEIILYHCRQAVRASMMATKCMLLFTDMACRRLSSNLCKSYEGLVASGLLEQYENGRGVLHGRNTKMMDVELVDAMVEAMKGVGVNIKRHIDQLRKKEHAVSVRPINLLDSFYHLKNMTFSLGNKVEYFQANDPDSSFSLIADNNVPVRLNLTYRTPACRSGNRDIKVRVNGKVVKTLSVNDKWQTSNILVTPEAMCDGINKVQIEWPLDTLLKDARRAPLFAPGTDASDVIYENLYPVFGEIYMFTAVRN